MAIHLSKSIERLGLNNGTFGALIGEVRQQVRRWSHWAADSRFQMPRADAMAAIYVATDGATGPADFYALPEVAAARARARAVVLACIEALAVRGHGDMTGFVREVLAAEPGLSTRVLEALIHELATALAVGVFPGDPSAAPSGERR